MYLLWRIIHTDNTLVKFATTARNQKIFIPERGGGVLLKPQNYFPFIRVILAEKGTHFRDFSRNNRSICQNLWVFAWEKLRKFWKNGPMFKYIFVKIGPMFRDFLWKRDPIEWHIPVGPMSWYVNTPPPGFIHVQSSSNA